MTEQASSKSQLRLRRRKAKNASGEPGESTNTSKDLSIHSAPPTIAREQKEENGNAENSNHSKRDDLSSVGKVVSAAKNTLSKPLSATRKMVRDVSSHKPKMRKDRDTSESRDLSTEEGEEEAAVANDNVPADEEEETSHAKEAPKKEDDSTVMVSNSIHAKQPLHETTVASMGPVLSFFLHDATIAIVASLLIAALPTIHHFDAIMENTIPASVSLTWILVAFTVGYQVALYRFLPTTEQEVEESKFETLTIPSEIDVPTTVPQKRPRRGYSVMRRMSIHFPIMRLEIPAKIKSRQAWSSLTTKRGQQLRWQRGARGQVSDVMMNRLLRNPMYQRKSVEVEASVVQAVAESAQFQKMGTYEPPDAESLKQDVIEPLFQLRGMDVFMTQDLEGGAEDKMHEHPFLIENGLRDTPSFVVNMMSQWANILIYFEMPSWVKDWDNIVEQEDDPDDVKALKKFLNGNDEYKSLRLKMLPHLVDGPYPIRMVAPAKQELTVHCDKLPTRWHQSNGRTNESDGRYLYPCLEVELDLMANKTMRGFASLAKRYLSKMSVDVAMIIDTPDMQEEEELSACVAMWRFDKVDLSQCPDLPERRHLGYGERADAIRASMLMEQTQRDLQCVRDELGITPEAESAAAG